MVTVWPLMLRVWRDVSMDALDAQSMLGNQVSLKEARLRQVGFKEEWALHREM